MKDADTFDKIMLDILQHFDQAQPDLRSRIGQNPDMKYAQQVMSDYLLQLHRDFAETANLYHARRLNSLLEILRYSLHALSAITVHSENLPVPVPHNATQQPSSVPEWIVQSGKYIQAAVAIAFFILILTNPATSLWMLLVVLIILFFMEKYLQALKRGHMFSWFAKRLRSSASAMLTSPKPSPVSAPQKMSRIESDVRAEVNVTAFLHEMKDALSFVNILLREETPKAPVRQNSDLFEKESELLKFFQDLYDALYDGDGKWALKQVLQLGPILEEHGITVKTFEPDSPESRSYFTFDPSEDPEYRTIRPAFLKGEQILLRGLVNMPAE